MFTIYSAKLGDKVYSATSEKYLQQLLHHVILTQDLKYDVDGIPFTKLKVHESQDVIHECESIRYLQGTATIKFDNDPDTEKLCANVSILPYSCYPTDSPSTEQVCFSLFANIFAVGKPVVRAQYSISWNEFSTPLWIKHRVFDNIKEEWKRYIHDDANQDNLKRYFKPFDITIKQLDRIPFVLNYGDEIVLVKKKE